MLHEPTIRIKAQSGRGNVQITIPHSIPSPYLRQYTENAGGGGGEKKKTPSVTIFFM